MYFVLKSVLNNSVCTQSIVSITNTKDEAKLFIRGIRLDRDENENNAPLALKAPSSNACSIIEQNGIVTNYNILPIYNGDSPLDLSVPIFVIKDITIPLEYDRNIGNHVNCVFATNKEDDALAYLADLTTKHGYSYFNPDNKPYDDAVYKMRGYGMNIQTLIEIKVFP